MPEHQGRHMIVKLDADRVEELIDSTRWQSLLEEGIAKAAGSAG